MNKGMGWKLCNIYKTEDADLFNSTYFPLAFFANP